MEWEAEVGQVRGLKEENPLLIMGKILKLLVRAVKLAPLLGNVLVLQNFG